MVLKKLTEPPLSIGAGAVYPYSDELLEKLSRLSKYDDGAPFSMGRVIGTAKQQRILVPRNMAPEGGTDLREEGLDFTFESTFVPRNQEQARIVYEAKGLLDAGESFLISAPTGVGKTVMCMDILAHVGKKTLVVITKADIEDQWAAAAHQFLGLGNKINQHVRYGNGLGLIKADTCVVSGCGLVIAYVQSIAKPERYPADVFKGFGFVIWDECHRVGADFFSQSAFRVPAKLRMGVSATTDRPDGRMEVIVAHIGPVKVVSELMAMKATVKQVLSPWKCPLTTVVNEKTGKREIRSIPHSPGKCGHVTKMIARHYGRNRMICEMIAAAYKKDRKILVQSDLHAHLAVLKSMLPSFGVSTRDTADYIGGMTKKEREDAKKKRVLMATYAMTKEATDIPALDTLVMATPKSDVRQIVGRILRLHEGKKAPYVFDIIDASSPVFMNYSKRRKSWYDEEKFLVQPPNAA